MKPKPSNTRAKETPNGTPGHVLKTFFMEPLGLTAYRVAKDIGITAIAMSHILRGKRGITPSVALRLGFYFGVEPEFWLNLQAHHDLSVEAVGKRHGAVERCAALDGRAFVLKETKSAQGRNWQVLMAKTRNGGAAAKGNGKR
jgi:addiction module HigA family antidote